VRGVAISTNRLIDKKVMEIKKAYVHFNNDPSVGMFPYGFELDVNILDVNSIEEIRTKISELYELMEGEKPTYVRFDVEIQAEIEAENKMEKEAEKYYEELDKTAKSL